MAEENQKIHEYGASETTDVEIKDRGVLDFLGKGKEEEKPQEEAIASEFDKVKVSEPETKVEEKKEEEGEKKQSLLEKLHRSDSSSSSSGEEEEEEGGEKKKKKKGMKENIQEEQEQENTAVPVEKVEVDPAHPEEKKGFLDKIKEKLPGQQKKTEEVSPPSPASSDATDTSATVAHEVENKDKKGILEKIKEKLPGYHPKTEEEKEKEKDSGAY